MRSIFKEGDQKKYSILVKPTDVAAFESGKVHDVYSTFALARDAEWSGRLFVLDMKDTDEEGIGTRIEIKHRSPAFVGNEVVFIATYVESNTKGEIITSFQAYVGDRLIAEGLQGQRILPKKIIEEKFQTLLSNEG